MNRTNLALAAFGIVALIGTPAAVAMNTATLQAGSVPAFNLADYAYVIRDGDVLYAPEGVTYSVVTGGVPSTPPPSEPTSTATPSPSPLPTPSETPSAQPSSSTSTSPSVTPSTPATPSPSPSPTSSPTPPPTPSPTATAGPAGSFIGPEVANLPTSGAAWTALKSWADKSVASPSVSDQDDPDNVITLAKALVYARTGTESYRTQVIDALKRVQSSSIDRALALGRELGAYVLAADYIGYRDPAFVSWVSRMRTVPTSGGPATLVKCMEQRPQNWGSWCTASVVIADLYLRDDAGLQRAITVFRGFLGDRAAYAGFTYGNLAWQCDNAKPVGINPECVKQGVDIGGVIPDDQRRQSEGGPSFPVIACENYVHEALQGITLTATILSEAGYDPWTWSDRAIVRSFVWLYRNDCPATGDDTGNVHAVNHYSGSTFEEKPANPGKGWGFQDWLLP